MVDKIPSYMIDPATGVSTPSQLTANQNNYDPGALTSVLRLSSDASRTVTGLSGGSSGRTITILNIGAQSLVFAHASASSLAANRISFGAAADFTLSAGKSFQLIYDATSTVWRDLGASSSGGGGSNSTVNWSPVVTTGTGSSQSITIPETGLTVDDLYVAINGLLQIPTVDYTISGNAVSITAETNAAVIVRKNIGPMGVGGSNAAYATSSENIQSSLATNVKAVTPSGFQSNFDFAVLTDASTVAWNVIGNLNAKLTATSGIGNTRTITGIGNACAGFNYALLYIQDGVGGRALTFGSAFGTYIPIDTGANAQTLLVFLCTDATPGAQKFKLLNPLAPQYPYSSNAAVNLGPVANSGVLAEIARSDHIHQFPLATISQTFTANGTLATTDHGRVVEWNAASAFITLPNSLPTGFNCLVRVIHATGLPTFSAANGATIRQADSFVKARKQWSEVSVSVRSNANSAAAEYVISGDLSA